MEVNQPLKVKIRDTVGLYQRPGKLWEVYYPGDIIEVSASEFYPDIMEKIEEPKYVGVDSASAIEQEEPVVTVTAEEPAAEPISEEPKPTKRRRKT
jgi:hypothetical protein